jgi:N-acetylneuraminic acid mutarotase
MKQYITLIALLVILGGEGWGQETFVPTPIFTWMDGSQVANEPAIYGAKGEIVIGNTEVGSRNDAGMWDDGKGHLWLFGGAYNNVDNPNAFSPGNDLWRYNKATRIWTWISGSDQQNQFGVYGTKGVSNPDNVPGARSGAFTWIGPNDKLYLFGGRGFAASGGLGFLNDTWVYDIPTGEWTWISGSNVVNDPGNAGAMGQSSVDFIPSGRAHVGGKRLDDGSVLVFGGTSILVSQNYISNALWKFDPASLEWTFLKGSTDATTFTGVYGTKGVTDPNNRPPSLQVSKMELDKDGNIWLFGGTNTANGFNALWKYEIATNNWTWISGSNLGDRAGVYGTKGVASSLNMPGTRGGMALAYSNDHKLLVFGGFGADEDNAFGFLSDYWEYDFDGDLWTWWGGNKLVNQAGNIPGIDEISFDAIPNPRINANAIFDTTNNSWWVFGGGEQRIVSGQLVIKFYNGLWEFNPDFRLWKLRYGGESANTRVAFGEKNIGIAYATPGGRSDMAGVTLDNNDLLLFGGRRFNGTGGDLNDLWTYSFADKQWIWLGGWEDEVGTPNYGTQGTSSPDNIPGARVGHKMVHFSDDHILLFGGQGTSETGNGYLNDLWRYNHLTKQWSWIGGSKLRNTNPNYGSKGEASPTSSPGGKLAFSMYKAEDGTIWIFGGLGIAESGAIGYTNDLWKLEYNTNTSSFEYTWVSGSKQVNQAGIYGTQGIGSASNMPGGKIDAALWVDASGDLYLFSGTGYDENGTLGAMNDLWKFNPSTNEWTWLSGSKTANATGFGTLNTESPTIVPTQRGAYDFWVDPNNYLWAFGGGGTGQSIFMWRYNMQNNLWGFLFQSIVISNNFGVQGAYSTDTRLGWRNRGMNWYSNGFLWHFGGVSFDKNLTQGRMNDLWRIDVFQNSQAPTDILISDLTIHENNLAEEPIGTLLVLDPDPDDFFTFEISPETAADTFAIVNNKLVALIPLNFELQSSYQITIKVMDKTGLSFEKGFVVNVIDVDEAPTDILLSKSSLDENSGENVIVGQLSAIDEDANETFTFALVGGTGDAHNSSFEISGNNLIATTSFDFEAISNPLSIRVEVTDKDGLTFAKALAIIINDINDAPTDIMISTNSFEENLNPQTVIGNLSTVDQDQGDTHSYQVLVVDGSTDHEAFEVQGSSLRSTISFNFEEKSSYEIRIKSTDAGGLTFEKNFTILITDGPDAPTDIMLQPSAIEENLQIGALVGTLTAEDEDANEQHSFAFVAGEGSADNAIFSITDNQLFALQSFDFETRNSYSVRVRTTDKDNLTYDKILLISIIDVNEAPRDILLSNISIAENNEIGDAIGVFTAVDDLLDEFHVFSLVSGVGSTDNNFFSISGDELIALSSFDFEEKSSYQIRVRATDAWELSVDKTFIIQILDLPEAPTDILLSSLEVEEGQEVGTLVGTLSTIDPDDPQGSGTYSYSLTSAFGGFAIQGNQLVTSGLLRRADRSHYDIDITSTDFDDLSYTKSFRIEVLPLNDRIAPEISFQNLPGSYVFGSNEGQIAFSVIDNFQVESVSFHYRNLGESQFIAQDYPVVSNGLYQFGLTEELMNGVGIEFFVQASDTSNNLASTAIQRVSVSFTSTSGPAIGGLGSGGQMVNYRMFALPFQLEDTRIESIFERNLTPYNKQDWRLLHWANNRYIEYKEGLSNIEIGKGYWFNSEEPAQIKVGIGTIPNYSESNPYSLSLVTGWNQVGNPYPFDISWAEVLSSNSVSTGVGQANVYRGASSGYQTTDLLSKYEGAFVFSEAARNITVPFRKAELEASSTIALENTRQNPSQWTVDFTLSGMQDRGNTLQIGMSTQNDSYKSPIPPRFIEYLELASLKTEEVWPWYSQDILSVHDRGSWEVVINQNYGLKSGSLIWEKSQELEKGQLMMVDERRCLVIDLIEQSNYTFDFGGGENYHFKILYDVNGVEDLNLSVVNVGAVFPNPMQSSAMIPVLLPDYEGTYEVEISCVDLSGRNIRQTTQVRLPSGYHLIPLERGTLSSGIYLCQVRIKGAASYQFTSKISIR